MSSAPSGHAVGQAYLLFAVSAVLVLTVGVSVQALSAPVGLTLTELLLILAPAVVFVRRKELPVAEALRWRPIPLADGVVAFAVGVTGAGVAAGILALSEPLLGEMPPSPGLEAHSLPHLLAIHLYGTLLPAVCEESLFRGAIQGVLRRRGRRWAVGVTALLFALFHLSPWAFAPALFLGVVFGTLVVRSGSTLSAILAHAGNNTVAITLAWLYRGREDPETGTWVIALLAAGCLLTFPLAWWRSRRLAPPPPLLATVPAATGWAVRRVAVLTGAAAALALAALLIAGIALVGVHTVTGDDLEPHYHRGDRLVLFKAGAVPLDLEVGDVVTFERAGRREAATITSLDAEEVRVRHGGEEHRLARREVRAKAVYVLPGLLPAGGSP